MIAAAMVAPSPLWLLFTTGVLGLGVPLALGVGYADRLIAPTGFYTVHVADTVVTDAPVRRPRSATLVVLDGLGHEEAIRMPTVARLQAHGQCRLTDVGSLPMSRPVYAVLSTGLEADRTGIRDNDDPSPLAIGSLWHNARASGLRVAAISELSWWRELFPGGFDTYELAGQDRNYFTLAPAGDLRLIHPLYIDEAGHEFGAGSPQYHEAVARADRELDGYLDTLDLAQDLVVVTADHGHSLRGGHGGVQDRVAHVITCLAGRGVRPRATPGPLRSTSIAPALTLLLGLPFPAEMRAGDDELGLLWELIEPAAFSAQYRADRERSLARFRAANAAKLREWWPASEGSWDRFYAHHRARQRLSAVPALAAAVGVLALQARAHRRRRPALIGLGFVAMFYLVLFAGQVGLRGSFDLSGVAGREQFISFTVTLAALTTLAVIGLHLLIRRDQRALLIDLSALSLTGTLLCLAHPLAYGWHPGFPLPPPSLYFLPYFAALALPVSNGLGLLFGLACVVWAQHTRRVRARTAA
jgi:hypothetical protein